MTDRRVAVLRKSYFFILSLIVLFATTIFLSSIGIDIGVIAALVIVVTIVLAFSFSNQDVTSSPFSRPQRNVFTEFEDICDDSNTKSFREIKEQLRIDISKLGWEKTRKEFMKDVRDGFGTQWFSENLFLENIF